DWTPRLVPVDALRRRPAPDTAHWLALTPSSRPCAAALPRRNPIPPARHRRGRRAVPVRAGWRRWRREPCSGEDAQRLVEGFEPELEVGALDGEGRRHQQHVVTA